MNSRPFTASIVAASLLVPTGGGAVTLAPSRMTPAAARPGLSVAGSALLAQQRVMIAALQRRVKYVFVLYQENRSFDSYFGTFPRADGLYSQPAAQTRGFSQPILNVDGTTSLISPFRIGPNEYAADTDDVDHSHARLISKVDVTTAGPLMDGFALVEEQKHYPAGTLPTLQAKQYGELTMAHEDCDTIPLLWNYANRFVLFDHIFQSYLGPSTPGNIAIIAAQAGETQAALHTAESYPDNGTAAAGVPVLNDRNPAWGPNNPGDNLTPSALQLNLTFATQPLTLAGPQVGGVVSSDKTSGTDFADILDDVNYVAGERNAAAWGWFQEGYDQEPGQPTAAASLSSYITHHNGPQYFGYLANSSERANFHGLNDFMVDVSTGRLPGPGVFYVKGGFHNIMGLAPADPDAKVQTNFLGDDDHPGYSDAQISEALVAQSVNRIVKSKYWSQSAIVITYDDSEGDYDHVPPPLRSIGPGVGNAPADFLSDGPRVPLIVISPFAKDHAVEHAYGDQGSVVKLVDKIFGLPALSDLPDEQKGRYSAAIAGKLNYGPDDGDVNGISDLSGAFDLARLAGAKAPLPAAYAHVPEKLIYTLPQTSGIGCRWAGIVPVDYLRGIANKIPADFNPRPATDPTVVTTPSLNTRRAVMQAHDPED